MEGHGPLLIPNRPEGAYRGTPVPIDLLRRAVSEWRAPDSQGSGFDARHHRHRRFRPVPPQPSRRSADRGGRSRHRCRPGSACRGGRAPRRQPEGGPVPERRAGRCGADRQCDGQPRPACPGARDRRTRAPAFDPGAPGEADPADRGHPRNRPGAGGRARGRGRRSDGAPGPSPARAGRGALYLGGARLLARPGDRVDQYRHAG